MNQRGSTLRIDPGNAPGHKAELAYSVIDGLYELVQKGHRLHPSDVIHACRIIEADPSAHLASYFGDVVAVALDGRPISPRSEGQRQYVHALRKHDVVFGIGPAGSGKTYLAIAMAVASLQRGECKRIILSRPAVEAGEKLGFLPGDLTEKVDPYLRPLQDALRDLVPQERLGRWLQRDVVEVAPLAFMRGRTLEDAFVVLDEAQNTTVEQMRMFLTRLGTRSSMVITGDITQIDLHPKVPSGLVRALEVLADTEGIGVARMQATDIVRHPLVTRIVKAWTEDDDARRGRRGA